MRCPKCDKNTRVLESRARSSWQYRRRLCAECGYRYATREHEILKGDLDELLQTVELTTRKALVKYGR